MQLKFSDVEQGTVYRALLSKLYSESNEKLSLFLRYKMIISESLGLKVGEMPRG